MKSEHVAIVRVQVTQPGLLLLALAGMLAPTPSTFAVLGDEGEEVEGTTDGGETDESKGEGIAFDVLGSTTGQETEGSDDPTTITEADLECRANAAPQVSADY